MATLKIMMSGLLVGGTTITGAVVLDQFGYMNWRKTFREEIQNWLSQDSRKDWIVKIKKDSISRPEELKNFKDDAYLSGLKVYLEDNEDKLASLALGTDKILIFEKTGKEWKLSLTKENIEKWVEIISGNKAILKFAEGNTSQELTYLTQELNSVLDGLFSNKVVFDDIKKENPQTPKNVLFEKIGNDWKHSKTEIKKWLSEGDGSKFILEVQKGSEEGKILHSADEENLIGLLGYLNSKKETIPKLIKDKTPTNLTFKKESNSWDVVHNETTINNWVSNVSEERVSLEVWKDGTKQQLSDISGELKQLLTDLKTKEKSLFKENLGSASKTSPKTIVFEKTESGWKHIKEAIEKFLSSKSWNKSKIKIEKGEPKTQTEILEVKDDELTGLLKHLKDKSESYKSIVTGSSGLVLKKKASGTNEWEQVTSAPGTPGG